MLHKMRQVIYIFAVGNFAEASQTGLWPTFAKFRLAIA